MIDYNTIAETKHFIVLDRYQSGFYGQRRLPERRRPGAGIHPGFGKPGLHLRQGNPHARG